MIWLLVPIVAILLMPFAAQLLRQPMSAARQARAPGKIAHLPGGATHYKWTGREGDPVVVCIHGLSTPSYVFAATERSLASLGFRVLTYDLYGRGYSARLTGPGDIGAYVAQLSALLAHQDIDGPISLLGFSMGGQIAAAYAAESDRIERLILVAPSGLAGTLETGGIWTAPGIGDWMTLVFGGIALRRELVEHKSIATVIPDFEDRQAAETRMRGFLPALLSSRRRVLSQSALEDHERIAFLKTPVLAIWGSSDPVVPKSAMGALAQINPEAQHVEIKRAGHNLLQTHPSEVAAALQGFLAD